MRNRFASTTDAADAVTDLTRPQTASKSCEMRGDKVISTVEHRPCAARMAGPMSSKTHWLKAKGRRLRCRSHGRVLEP